MRLVLQVVDIVSTWRSLGPELSCDSRPLMVRAIAELLALVPQLTVKSEEYEVSHLLHESFCLMMICSAVFVSLCLFLTLTPPQ